ncbi:MAG: hypothetical protein P1V18_02340 [Candidatus Gracilibacteria bacterium]|nr:hypothetical protein [Candidatus Gracilibacteria bacterium]
MKFDLPLDSFQQFESDRGMGLGYSNDLRIESKAAIGHLLKGKMDEANERLVKAEQLNNDLQDLMEKTPYLISVGGFHVGPEEYVEAKLLSDYLEEKPLSSPEDLRVHHESYLCGLCDMSGELLRLARFNPGQMEQILNDITELYQSYMEAVVTRNSSIRKKMEDLERNMKRMEEMIYTWNLKHS